MRFDKVIAKTEGRNIFASQFVYRPLQLLTFVPILLHSRHQNRSSWCDTSVVNVYPLP